MNDEQNMDDQSSDRLIFLSYSRKDVSIMRRVREELENNGIAVWTDEGLTPGTESWKTAIEQAIEQAAGLVAILSPSAKESLWVERELEFASVNGLKVYPILAKGDSASAIPIELISSQWVDIRGKRNIADPMQNLALAIKQQFLSGEVKPIVKLDKGSSSPQLAKWIVIALVTVIGIVIVFVVFAPKIIASLSTETPTITTQPTLTSSPTQTQTPTSSPTHTPTVSAIPAATLTPSLMPTVQLYPGRDFKDDCISSEFWQLFYDPISTEFPIQENDCWELRDLGFTA